MATLFDLHERRVGNPVLRQRFQAARMKATWDIFNESPSTEYHTERLAWANKVNDDYNADVDKEYARFLSNATIQSGGEESTDNDIIFVVNSFLNTFAGV